MALVGQGRINLAPKMARLRHSHLALPSDGTYKTQRQPHRLRETFAARTLPGLVGLDGAVRFSAFDLQHAQNSQQKKDWREQKQGAMPEQVHQRAD
jgi:hypothetical protein